MTIPGEALALLFLALSAFGFIVWLGLSDTPNIKKLFNSPLRWGGMLTGIWAFLVLWFVWYKWCELKGASSNNVGDFVAGAAAPVAAFWLIVTLLSQRAETRVSIDLSRDALRHSTRTVDIENIEKRIKLLADFIFRRKGDLYLVKKEVEPAPRFTGRQEYLGKDIAENDPRVVYPKLLAVIENVSLDDHAPGKRIQDAMKEINSRMKEILVETAKLKDSYLSDYVSLLELQRFDDEMRKLYAWVEKAPVMQDPVGR